MNLIQKLKSLTEEFAPKPPPAETLESLVAAKKITYAEQEIYLLFSVDERGSKWVKRMMESTFMDPALPDGLALAYSEGRRSMLREIKTTIERINQLLRGDYDNRYS